MPRGIPNVKRDDTGLRYTSFHVPLLPNPKHVNSSYLKAESQSLWYRKSLQKPAEESSQSQDRRGSQVLVIHPGSQNLRIGRASDVTPVTIANVIARKTKNPPTPTFIENISRPASRRPKHGQSNGVSDSPTDDEYHVVPSGDDPFETKVAEITSSLRERMRFYKMRVAPNAVHVATTFNQSFQPEVVPQHNDPFQLEWINETCQEDVIVGERVTRIGDPEHAGYSVRWPIYGSNFNTRDYPSLPPLLGDVETILRYTLKDRLNIQPRDYKNFSVILVIPDLYDRSYVREFVHILLVCMGFKQLCAQQESLAATYGAGVSNACVVNIGAKVTSVACVDEGLVIADSRMSLNIGGDDITEFLYVLLERIGFPYRDANLVRAHDWDIIENLKLRICTLSEGDVALNLYDFVVRRPGKATEKYGLRAYDEVILAPMCIFEPRVIEFDRKRIGFKPIGHPDVTEDVLEFQRQNVTQAMMISTQHLFPSPENSASTVQEAKPEAPSSSSSSSSTQEPSIIQINGEPKEPGGTNVLELPLANPPTDAPTEGVIADVTPYGVDIVFEAGKLPLDVAIFNSARASGGDEKIRKYLQAVLIIGGTARTAGMTHALESRLQAIATPLVQNMEKVTIIAPPKEVDPQVLAWKGAAVLGKMDGCSELWVTPSDWDTLGMRGLKERCFFL